LYSLPSYFASDWLNNSPLSPSMYKFLYLGPSTSSTRLHTDVLQSFSWSSNVVGRKLWRILRPSDMHLLFDVFGNNLAPHLHSDKERGGLGEALYPGLKVARERAVSVTQKTGETIFVPSGWPHEVQNLENTLSINHNWINEFNVRNGWEKLRRELLAMEGEVGEGGDGDEDMGTVVGDLRNLRGMLGGRLEAIRAEAEEEKPNELKVILEILQDLESVKPLLIRCGGVDAAYLDSGLLVECREMIGCP